MCWLKREMWKAGIALAGMLLLLILMIWLPVSAAGAYEGTSGLATPVTGMVLATPTEDATVTALNKEKLQQEIQQLEYQNEQLKDQNSPDFFLWLPGWLRTNAAILLSTLAVVIGALIGLFRWLEDRDSERGKRDEERFQVAIERLGSTNQATQVGAAITLRTFLDSGYERFYYQTFDLAVAHLRLRKVDPISAEPSVSLSQALVTIFKESFLKVRPRLRWIDGKWPEPAKSRSQFYKVYVYDVNAKAIEQQLNAAHIQLDNAYLANADLRYAWMLQAYLREANLWGADLRHANLRGARLDGANLIRANLFQADLIGARLDGANLIKAKLIDADLSEALQLHLFGGSLPEGHLGEDLLRVSERRHVGLECGSHLL